jgi:hypothetical protein
MSFELIDGITAAVVWLFGPDANCDLQPRILNVGCHNKLTRRQQRMIVRHLAGLKAHLYDVGN